MNPEVILKATDPYPFMVFRNAFRPGVAERMLKEWPEKLLRRFDYRGGIKDNFSRAHPEWSDFVNGSELWGDLLKPETLVEAGNIFAKILGEKVRLTGVKVEFSSLPNGGGLMPHPDGPDKLMSAVIYVPDEVWHPSWGGEFRVVRHKTEPKGDFTAKILPWEDVDLIADAQFLPNRVVVFARRPWSLHGVRPVMCPAGFTRKSLTINWIGERI